MCKVMQDLYDPDAYFGRLEDLYIKEKMPFAAGIAKYWCRHPWSWLTMQAKNLAGAIVLFSRLMRNVPDQRCKTYRQRLWRLIKARPDPNLVQLYIIKCGMHYHQHTMANQMATGDTKVFNSF